MPVKKSLGLKDVLLPSGITCKIGLTWGEKKKINNVWLEDLKLDTETSKPTGDIPATIIQKQNELALSLAVKEWDMTFEDGKPVPITLEELMSLDGDDGEVLEAAITELLKTENSEEVKKA